MNGSDQQGSSRGVAIVAAFVAGVAVGALVCLVLTEAESRRTERDADARQDAVSAAAADAPPYAPPSPAAQPVPGEGARAAPARARGPRRPGGAKDVSAPRGAEGDADHPAAAHGAHPVDGALVPNTPEGAAAPVPPASGVAVEVAAEMTVSEEEVPDPVNPAATQGLARARAAADEAVAAGRSASDAVLDSLVRSADDGDRETAIGLALAADPPRIDRLLQIARDAAVGGSLRATALYAAVEAAEGDADVGAAVADLAADRDVVVRRTAIELFPRIGVRGAERAILLLRSGDYPDELLAPLANAVAMSEKALDFLLGRSEPDAAFAVITALGETEPADAATRAALLARLPDVVRPLLGTPEMLLHAEEAFGACASAGHAAFLRSVAVAASLPTSIRLAAVDAAANDDACADGLPSLVSAVLADGRNPVELLRAVLARVPPELVADDAVRSSITALAESHANAWLREEARAKLQSVPASSEDGALRIVSATYGKDGSTIEVTAALRAMVVGGRLVVEAGNDLAGDPLVGVVKDLAVVYVWKGERRTRTIHEYEVLTLP